MLLVLFLLLTIVRRPFWLLASDVRQFRFWLLASDSRQWALLASCFYFRGTSYCVPRPMVRNWRSRSSTASSLRPKSICEVSTMSSGVAE